MNFVTKQSVSFFDYYKNLPTRSDQKELRFKILKECKVKKPTFYSWLNRGDVPDEKSRNIISDILSLPVEDLFPTSLNN